MNENPHAEEPDEYQGELDWVNDERSEDQDEDEGLDGFGTGYRLS